MLSTCARSPVTLHAHQERLRQRPSRPLALPAHSNHYFDTSPPTLSPDYGRLFLKEKNLGEWAREGATCWAVRRGRQVGVFERAFLAFKSVHGFNRPQYRGFHKRELADAWCRAGNPREDQLFALDDYEFKESAKFHATRRLSTQDLLHQQGEAKCVVRVYV